MQGILAFVVSSAVVLVLSLKLNIQRYNSFIILYLASAIVGYRFEEFSTRGKKVRMSRLEKGEEERNILVSQLENMEVSKVQFEARLLRYRSLKDTTEKLSTTLELDRVLQIAIAETFNILRRSERIFIFLVDENKQELNLKASKIRDSSLGVTKAKKGELYDNWVLKQRRPLLIEELDEDFRFAREGIVDLLDQEFKSVISSPLVTDKNILGVIRLDARRPHTFSTDDLRLLGIISNLVAVAIHNAILYRRVNELAIKDGLTGLYLHRYFRERLELETKRALIDKKIFSILMIDIDYFKDYNDRYGHAIGDILLKKIAAILTEGVSKGDFVARYGGEEFAVILFGVALREAVGLAEEIRRKIESRVFMLRRQVLRVTISIGVSSFGTNGNLPDELIKAADSNLYKAKMRGRNTVWPKLF